jgi:peptide/nickel transport system permease protein
VTGLLLRRLALLLLTLWITSVLVFFLTAVMPGDVGRIILGPFAAQQAVDALNAQLGYDQPVLVRYLRWAGGLVTGDWGRSLRFDVPVLPLVLDRLGRSLILACTSLVLLVPVGILLGLLAAEREGGPFDRTVTAVGMALGALPEFVTGVLLIVVFGLWLGVLPIQALPPPGAGPLDWARHLLMPALCLVVLMFAYVFRMMRASTADALAADYTRTAVLKGLPRGLVLRRHVLPNALVPTLAVLGTQLGWLVGGLVVVETLFRYPGLGSLIQFAAAQRDVPLLAGSAMAVAVVYGVGGLLADLAQLLLDPRARRGR